MYTDIQSVYKMALQSIPKSILECKEKYGSMDVNIHKLSGLFSKLSTFYINNEKSIENGSNEQSSYLAMDLGKLHGTISYYLTNGHLSKDHMEDLNKTYKRYK